jgi:Flp pilus assembly protein TadG
VNRRLQGGTTTVEFAIIGLVAMVVLFSLLEFSRLVFELNALNEATRRGARMAAVCPVNDPAITQVAIFNAPGGGGGSSPILTGLTASNVAVEYLNQTGGVIGSPAANFAQIRYVRVRMTNLQHTLLIPLFNLTLALPAYPTTLPRESLGIPRVGAGPLPC